jgi:membrane protein implicated in regulation of membrane protease activity
MPSAEAQPPGGLLGTIVAAIGGMGFIVMSLYLAWIAAPDYGIEPWQALALVFAAYLVVALSSWGVALVYNRTVDRREAQARGETETGTSTV